MRVYKYGSEGEEMHKPKNVNGELYVFGTHWDKDKVEDARLSSQGNATCEANYPYGDKYITIFKLVPLKTLHKKEYLEELKVKFKNIIK